MIEHVHKHITTELQQNTKTDTIFILAAILLNLITLGINSGMAELTMDDNVYYLIMFIFVALIVMVNLVVVFGLVKGKQTREKLLSGLIQMYKDQKVDQYYDESLLSNYSVRYNLFLLVVISTGIIACVIPFLLI